MKELHVGSDPPNEGFLLIQHKHKPAETEL